MNATLRTHRRVTAVALGFSIIALLAIAVAWHRSGVDKNVVGTWEIPVGAGRWLWKIDPNGTYEFHSEAADGVAPHSGKFSAHDGTWSLHATTGYADSGAYTFQPPDTLVATGRLGSGSWHRLTNLADDATAMRVWALPVNGGRWVWKIDRSGNYQFHSEAGDGVAPHSGKFSASGGYWWLEATNGYADGGTYIFNSPYSLTTTGHLGTATWQLDGGWAFQMAQAASSGDRNALQQLSTAAEQGDSAAQTWLATYFHSAKDDAEAFVWYRKAALQGDASAETNLGNDYAEARGVSQDDRQAFAWWTKSAAQGDVSAEFDVGNAYRDAKGVARDYVRAAVWWKKVAQHDATAKASVNAGVDAPPDGAIIGADMNLANAYTLGNGVPQSADQARYWKMQADAWQAKRGYTNSPNP